MRPDARGRHRIQLGKGTPYANSGGWQWLARYVVMEALGRKLRSDEHVHHRNGDKSDNRLENLEVLAAEYHGRLHGSACVIARDELGRFREVTPGPIFPWPRYAAVLGPSARGGLTATDWPW